MASCFYNGVLLPEIPSEALKNYPYCWIRNNTRTGHYDLFMAKSPWWQSDSTTIYTASYADGIQWYRTPMTAPGDDWTFNQSWTTNGGMADESDRNIIWSNQNIPVGAVTATTIYFVGSSAVPDVDVYKIQKDTVVDIADQVRRLCKTEATMTPAVIKSNLEGLNIELMETYVISDGTEQVIYPDEGYYGFSKITVGAVSSGGGGGSGDGGGGEGEIPDVPSDAGNTQFGYEIVEEEVPTGYFIYTYGGNTYRFKAWPDKYQYVFAYYDKSLGYIDVLQSDLPILYDSTYTRLVASGPCNYWLASGYSLGEIWSDGYHFTATKGQLLMAQPRSYNWMYTSHDIFNEDTGALWMVSTAANLTIETETVKTEVPKEVEDIYTVSGESMNEMVALAQKITGTNIPLTLEQAIKILDEYYAGLNGEVPPEDEVTE